MSPHLQTSINHNYISLFAEAALISSSFMSVLVSMTLWIAFWPMNYIALKLPPLSQVRKKVWLEWQQANCHRKWCNLIRIWQIKMAGLDGGPTCLCLYAHIFLCLQIWSLIWVYLSILYFFSTIFVLYSVANLCLCHYISVVSEPISNHFKINLVTFWTAG